MKNTIYAALIIILSLAIRWLANYPFLVFIAGTSWCVVGFLLIRNILKHIIKKKNK